MTGLADAAPRGVERDPLAIAGFVLAVLALGTGVSAFLGVIFSSIAYSRRDEHSGKTLMLWGFWINVAVVGFFVIAFMVGFVQGFVEGMEAA